MTARIQLLTLNWSQSPVLTTSPYGEGEQKYLLVNIQHLPRDNKQKSLT